MAADASAVKAGEAYVVLGIDMAPYQAALAEAKKRLQTFGKGIAVAGAAVGSLGAAITAPFFAGLSVVKELGEEIHGVASTFGLTGGQAAEILAAMSGSGGDLTGAMMKMQVFVADVARRAPGATSALRELGLSAADLTNVSPDEQLMRTMDALSQVGNVTQRLDLAKQILGKSAPATYAERFEGGRAGLERPVETRREAGTLMSSEDVDAADAFGKWIKRLPSTIKYFWAQVGAAAAPMMTWFNNTAVGVISTVVKGTSANRTQLATIFSFGLALSGAGSFIASLVGGIILLGTILGSVGTVLAFVGSVAGFLLSPFGLLLLAVGGVTFALFKFTDVGKSIKSVFGEASELASDTWRGVVDAITVGDLEGAFDIALLGLKVGWLEFKNWFIEVWDAVIDTFKSHWTAAVDFVA